MNRARELGNVRLAERQRKVPNGLMQGKKRISSFTGIGPLIGAIIGGANFGIQGAMIGGVLGAILISSGIEV